MHNTRAIKAGHGSHVCTNDLRLITTLAIKLAPPPSTWHVPVAAVHSGLLGPGHARHPPSLARPPPPRCQQLPQLERPLQQAGV
jgi:hypothetical protein